MSEIDKKRVYTKCIHGPWMRMRKDENEKEWIEQDEDEMMI